ncbi:MAG: hypothetical protein KDA78_10070 [Planctomycetaceae bacterium]|nr:hypothetical protein [Planctomycetaceae bacterium]
MSINFVCDQCSKKYKVGDEYAGRKMQCKECGAKLQIPGGSSSPAKVAAKASASSKQSAKSGSQRKSRPAPDSEHDFLSALDAAAVDPGRLLEPKVDKKKQREEEEKAAIKQANMKAMAGGFVTILLLVGLVALKLYTKSDFFERLLGMDGTASSAPADNWEDEGPGEEMPMDAETSSADEQPVSSDTETSTEP